MKLNRALSGSNVSANPHIEFVMKVMRSDLLVSDFSSFKNVVKEAFDKCQSNTSGKPADYIPSLAKANPNDWGVSICTVDG